MDININNIGQKSISMYKDIKNKTKSSKIWANYRHRLWGMVEKC
jgi:hypothetical protein